MADYGYELVLDLHDCDVDKFTRKSVNLFCVQICAVIDMELGDFHTWESDPENYDIDPAHIHGVSAVQFITTSSIVIHTLPKLRAVYVNVFSCKTFDAVVAEEFARNFFNGKTAGRHWLARI